MPNIDALVPVSRPEGTYWNGSIPLTAIWAMSRSMLKRPWRALPIVEASRLWRAGPDQYEQAVAGGLDNMGVVFGDRRVDQLAPMGFLARDGAFLVELHEVGIPDHVGGQYGGEATLHSWFPWVGRLAVGRPKIHMLGKARNVGSWLQADLQPPKFDFRLSPNFGHSRGRH